MSTINFPTNPTLNQLYSFGVRTWQWNGAAWILVNAGYGTFAITGSNTFTGNQTINANLNVSGSLTASGLIYPTTDGLEGQVLETNGAGVLSFGDVETMYEQIYTGENITKGDPLYISGSQGATPIVYKADAAIASKMPVIYIAAETIAAGNTSRGIVLGLITGMNLTGYVAGDDVYVAAGGGWTGTRPTGSAIVQVLGYVTQGGVGGKGLVLNPGPVDLPNIPQNNLWIGNASGVPVTQSKSVFLEGTFSSSAQVSYTGITGVPAGIYSSSAQLPSGLYSSSAQLPAGIISSSAQLPAGTVSSSAQITSLTNVTISGSTIISGSTAGNIVALSIASNTASLNASAGSFYTLLLVSGSTTRVEPTGVVGGRTFTLRVKQASVASGSVVFSSAFKFPTGSAYTATSTANAEDILSFITFDTGSIYAVSTKQMV